MTVPPVRDVADFCRRLAELRAAAAPAGAPSAAGDASTPGSSTAGGDPTAGGGPPARGGIPMRHVFALAKAFPGAEPADIEALLDGPAHEHRVGAVSIMDFQARRAGTPPGRRGELYGLYRRRHDRIDTWDLVDRAAPHVVGGWLHDRSRAPLDELAASPHWYERRTAIVATWFFIRRGEVADTFRIGATLAHDPVELVQKAVGGWVREAGKRDEAALRAFLTAYAPTMPRTALRYAVEHLPDRAHFLEMRGR